MSSDDEFDGVKLLWKIENFGYLEGDELTSPSFGPQLLWEIRVTRDKDKIEFIVERKENILNVEFYCSLAYLDSRGIPLTWGDGKIVKDSYPLNLRGTIPTTIYPSNRYLKCNFSFPNKTRFFPGNILTIEFRCSQKYEGLLLPITSHHACTRIEYLPKFIKKSFNFNISGVSNINPPYCSLEHKEIIRNGETLTTKIYLSDEEFWEAEISTSLFMINAKVQVFILDALGTTTEFSNVDIDIRQKKFVKRFSTNIRKSMLMCHSNKFLPADTLTLKFTCTISGKVTFNNLVEETEFPNTSTIYPRITASCRHISEPGSTTADEPETNQENEAHGINTADKPKLNLTISQTVHDIFRDGYLSDFKLKVGEKVFSVHKVILGARSKVFRAMFDSEMKEMQDNCVDIEDFDGDTLHRMLEFVYSDRLDQDMDWSEASNLYAAADFYALEALKQGCSEILKDGLSITSALEVLSMADLHQDRQLKSAALDFISHNDKDIIGNEEWIKLEKENGDLALETFRELYSRKMKG